MLTPEEEQQLQQAVGKGLMTDEEIRKAHRLLQQARHLLQQARRAGRTLSVPDALARAAAAIGKTHGAAPGPRAPGPHAPGPHAPGRHAAGRPARGARRNEGRAPILTPEEEEQLRKSVDKGLTTDEEIREARRLLQQARRVGWTLSVPDALARAAAAIGKTHGAAPSPDAAAAPAAEIDPADLRLLEKIGRSVRAVVYKCRQVSQDRILAVKILSARAARDREVRNSFIREGRHAARLVHPNIVRIYQVAPFKDTFFIAMEYVDGGSVADLLAARGRLEPAEAVRIVRAAAGALAYAHKQGFIHRDIKPKNILLTREGLVKVADLGLARRDADLDAAFAEVGKAYGTPYYISPEQVRGDPDTDRRTDIYSLGVTFYEMLAGRPPFISSDPQQVIQVMQMHLYKPVPDPRQFAPDVPESLCRILAKALAKNPKERFSSATMFIRALDRADLSGGPQTS